MFKNSVLLFIIGSIYTNATYPDCNLDDPANCFSVNEIQDFFWTQDYTEPENNKDYGNIGNEIKYTFKLKNDSAWLKSPVYWSNLTTDGCFYISYSITCPGLRVYQIPRYVSKSILNLSEKERDTFLSFEMRGKLGDTWFNAISALKPDSTDFQIVVEVLGGGELCEATIKDVRILERRVCSSDEATSSPPPQVTDFSSTALSMSKLATEATATTENKKILDNTEVSSLATSRAQVIFTSNLILIIVVYSMIILTSTGTSTTTTIT